MKASSLYTEIDLFASAGTDRDIYSVLFVSPTGIARCHATIPPHDSEFDPLLTRVSGKEKCVAIREKFGKLLFDSVFHGDILAAWATARVANDGVRLRLIFDQPASTLPWELLHDGLNFLATDRRLAISRYIPVSEPRVRPVIDRLKVLLVSASPKCLSPIKPEEVDEIKAAIDAVAEVEVKELRNCTASQLSDAITSSDYHVIHYLGHGAPGTLLLNSVKGEPEPLNDRAFAQMLFGHPSIRLVFLSACSSAQTAGNAFAGVGPALIRTGVPAVIAMQYQFVQLSTAKIFSLQMYKELSRGTPVDVAVNRSRNKISATDDLLAQRDWATPVLYLGTRGGRLITLGSEQADTVGKAAQAVQAAIMKDTAAVDAWDELKETFENLRTSYLALDALIKLRYLARQAREQFDRISGIAGQRIGGTEYHQITPYWDKMKNGVLLELRQTVGTINDTALKNRLDGFLMKIPIISNAIQMMRLNDLEREISETRQMASAQEIEAAARIDSMIADLVARSDRILGLITNKG